MAYAPPLTVYVLVPGGEGAAPLVLRLDEASTIRTVKHAIERQRPIYSRSQLELHLPNGGGPLGEADTLSSIGLTREGAPTLLLRVEGPHNPALHSVLESVVAPALEAAEAAAEAATAKALEAAERAAAMRIQSAARSIFARRELVWRLKARRLLALCARTEDRAADVIEHRVRAWHIRAHAEVRRREQNQLRAAAAIAAMEAEAAELAHGARLQETATFIARVWRVRRALRQAATTRRLEARVGGGESSAEMVAAISAAAGVDYSRATALAAPRPVGLVHVQVGFRTIGRYQASCASPHHSRPVLAEPLGCASAHRMRDPRHTAALMLAPSLAVRVACSSSRGVEPTPTPRATPSATSRYVARGFGGRAPTKWQRLRRGVGVCRAACRFRAFGA